MDKCRSWYTAEDGTVIGLWPGKQDTVTSLPLLTQEYLNFKSKSGSNLHSIHAMEHPRWEDYDYERVDDTPNRLFWLGDGQTVNEKNNSGDRKLYSTVL